eukprot:scaffold21391_cov67-Phaeocystis_antarctica.AAC.8
MDRCAPPLYDRRPQAPKASLRSSDSFGPTPVGSPQADLYAICIVANGGEEASSNGGPTPIARARRPEKVSKLVVDKATLTQLQAIPVLSRQDSASMRCTASARKTGGSKQWLINSQIALTLLSCLSGGTLIYGWAAYEPLLKTDDFYSSLCSNSTDGRAAPNECPPQQTALTL